MNSITITNKNATATSLVVDGSNRPIAGSGTITVDEGALTRLLADNVSRLRFLPAGDLSHTNPPPSGGPATSFSVTVDATTLGTTPLVPAVAGSRWETRRWRYSVVNATGSPTAASVSVRSAGTVISGISADGSFAPLSNFSGSSTAAGAGLDVSVDVAATGGALSVRVDVEGQFTT
jgi:hypothetical protein